MKKYNKGDEEIFKILVGKQLEKYNITYDYVKENQDKIKEEHGMGWFQYYTFDDVEEFNTWRDFCINFLTTRVTPKITKQAAESEFMWLNLAVGLKQKYMFIEQDIKKHLLKSNFKERSASLYSGFEATGIDVKFIEGNQVVIYIYDDGNANVMTIEGKVTDIDKNTHM